jgi:hypothetical protein
MLVTISWLFLTFLPGTNRHVPVNKQLNDKERVAAALENPALMSTLEQCLATADRRGMDVH